MLNKLNVAFYLENAMVTELGVKVGCCGFPVSRSKYFKTHNIVEIQQTFYKPPSIKTLRRWRNEAPGTFEFTIKAWQLITHSPKSPTWRKAGIKVEKSENYGFLKPTPENFKAWEKMVEIAEILKSTIIVVQTPPSFKVSDVNIKNALEFFRNAKSIAGNVEIAWEPRGDWIKKVESIKAIVLKTEIIHCVDPFVIDPAYVGNIVYLRLHGRNGKWPNYKYRYCEEDFNFLILKIRNYIEKGANIVYVMFNNIFMYNDSLSFKNRCSTEFKGLCI